ncbi:MAG: low specificity L-threonine aldolase [Actinomycetota bacterium]|nr:threonine aldolase [Actinomycetota bacterium]
MSADLEALRASCNRALNWHGNRTVAEYLSEIPTDLGIDRYGAGGAVEALEEEIRTVLDKPAAVFMPSGTMAQQIALRIHADRRGRTAFAFHPTSHLELHEEKAYERMHRLHGVPAGEVDRLLTLADLSSIAEPLAAFLFELPQREIGGLLPAWNELEEQVALVRDRGAAVHVDGARLWECTPYYGKSPAEIAALFDTVYVSLYKGLGGLGGCCLAGPEDVIDQARVWRRRHGGTLWALWPYAASGLAALRKRLPLMPRYYEHCRAIAAALRDIPNVEIVRDPPQTPMMHLHIRCDETKLHDAMLRLAKEEGIWTWPDSAASTTPSIRIVELTTGDATMTFAPDEVAKIIDRLVNA